VHVRVKRLLLVRHAPTSATRAAAFPDDEPIEEGAGERAARVGSLARVEGLEVLSSPALRCRQTAAAAGLHAVVDARLAESRFGAWAGRSLSELHASDPDAVAAWMTDPAAAPHGGESLVAFSARVGDWLASVAAGEGTTLAITHGGVVKAAVCAALDAPLASFWRVDVAPLTVTELHAHDGRWTVTRVNCPVEEAGDHPSVGAGRRAPSGGAR
jgi:broad specificity phosphatase PhoE